MARLTPMMTATNKLPDDDVTSEACAAAMSFCAGVSDVATGCGVVVVAAGAGEVGQAGAFKQQMPGVLLLLLAVHICPLQAVPE